MKILMLGWELPPHISGGMGVACYNMCKALSLRGVSIDFVVPYHAAHPGVNFMRIISSTSYSPTQLQQAGGIYDSRYFSRDDDLARATVRSIHLPQTLHQQRLYYMHAVEQLAKKHRYYDSIHAHDWLTFDAAIAAKKLLQKPLIAHVHATEFDRSGEHHGNPLVHEIEYTTLLLADKVIAVSQATKDLIVKEYALPASKIEVIHNSINPEEYQPLSATNSYAYLSHMKKRGYKVAVSASRLTAQKGLVHLLQAAYLVYQKNPKILFLICGAGDQYHELIELSAALGISQNVIFTSWVNGKTLRDSYAIADMFIMSSISEPFGLTALEAVADNTAVLVSRQSGVSEVLHNVLKFNYWDHQRLADEIISLAEHKVLSSALKQNARQELQRFSWTDVAQKCHDLYTQTQREAAYV